VRAANWQNHTVETCHILAQQSRKLNVRLLQVNSKIQTSDFPQRVEQLIALPTWRSGRLERDALPDQRCDQCCAATVGRAIQN